MDFSPRILHWPAP